jgi:nicotinate-nucleotide--dimethylbenzimidazole phosphoribosyltransferase
VEPLDSNISLHRSTIFYQTICVTEVYLLTIILLVGMYDEHQQMLTILGHILSDIIEKKTSFSDMVQSVKQNPEILSLVKFAVVMLFTIIWCSNVGLPPVFVRKTVAEKGSTDQIQIALVSGEQDSKKEEDTLEALLNDENNDFAQRYYAVRNYLDSLAKPVGSLGTLEDWAGRLAALQKTSRPTAHSVACLIFAADHGVAKAVTDGGMNCSAYPASVTEKVVIGLDNCLAGASVLAECNNVNLRVIDVGLAAHHEWAGDIVRCSEFKVSGGTKNFCKGNALTSEQVGQCVQAGRKETSRAIDELGCNVISFGEVGIGNTTTSAALIAALTDKDPVELCGSGASTSRDGVNPEVVKKKVSIVKEALKYHGASTMKGQPYKALKSVGGAEIAAIVGGILEATERNVPVLIDGFICTTATMIACHINPMASRAILFATESTEKGQIIAVEEIAKIALGNGLPPLEGPALRMKLRMGEGTGALTAVPLLRSACAILSVGTLEQVLSLEPNEPSC